MKPLLPLLLLAASYAPAAVIMDSFGFQVNTVSYEPVYQLVTYTQTPPWANLPGLQFYWELLMARAFADDSYIYNFVMRAVVRQINMDPPAAQSWVELVRVGQWTTIPPPNNDNTPEPATYALIAAGLFALGLAGRRTRSKRGAS